MVLREIVRLVNMHIRLLFRADQQVQPKVTNANVETDVGRPITAYTSGSTSVL